MVCASSSTEPKLTLRLATVELDRVRQGSEADGIEIPVHEGAEPAAGAHCFLAAL